MLIIGRKVKIRNFEKTDFDQFWSLVNDKNNHDLAGLEYTSDETFAKNLFDMYLRREDTYVIALVSDNSMVGIIELNKRGESESLILTREVGFVVDSKYRQKGYASEAVKLIVDFGRKELHLNEIWASTEESNTTPQKLLEKLGFKYIYSADESLPFVSQHNVVKYYLLKG